jgi:microcystin-dependent protein
MCSNCYNGCVEVSSDKCVRYTGVNIPELGISNGDTLFHVEQQLIAHLTSVINGSGIKITFAPSILCDLIKKYLPTCGDVSLNDVLITLVNAVCDLQAQVTGIKEDVDALNADYNIGCLTGVTSSSDTHDVVQAVIASVCSAISDLEALSLNVTTNYVLKTDIDSYIAEYLASIPSTNKAYSNMVPYTVVEYYGSLSNFPNPTDGFDVNGVGQGYWEKVYLCNGLNATPDKRGRVGVGVIVGVGGGPLNSAVNPASSPFNPNYDLTDIAGANSVTLTNSQIPAHTHPTTVGDPGHKHPTEKFYARAINYGNENSTPVLQSQLGTNSNLVTPSTDNSATTATTGVSVSVNPNTGGGGAHSNTQPSLACYYIMYKP